MCFRLDMCFEIIHLFSNYFEYLYLISYSTEKNNLYSGISPCHHHPFAKRGCPFNQQYLQNMRHDASIHVQCRKCTKSHLHVMCNKLHQFIALPLISFALPPPSLSLSLSLSHLSSLSLSLSQGCKFHPLFVYVIM